MSDYGAPGSSPLTGMGQRSVSASNLAAMGSLPLDFLNSQAQRELLRHHAMIHTADWVCCA
jgi:hypothetical protein